MSGSPSVDRLRSRIESFLAKTGMSETYFGKVAAGNPSAVSRLRRGGSITLHVADRLDAYITAKEEELKRGKKAVD